MRRRCIYCSFPHTQKIHTHTQSANERKNVKRPVHRTLKMSCFYFFFVHLSCVNTRWAISLIINIVNDFFFYSSLEHARCISCAFLWWMLRNARTNIAPPRMNVLFSYIMNTIICSACVLTQKILYHILNHKKLFWLRWCNPCDN